MNEKDNKPSFELTFGLTNIFISIQELIGEVCNPKDYEKFDRLFSLHRLYQRAIEEGYEKFDWKVMHENGHLSSRDYKLFEKELNGLTEEMYWKALGYDSIPGRKK
jgi:hypothetical protein